MKIAHFSTSDAIGGAAQATYKLHKNLMANGIDSRLFVKYIADNKSEQVYELEKNENRFSQKLKNIRLTKLKSNYHLKPHTAFSWNKFLPNYSLAHEYIEQADIIGLYWIGEFLSPEIISRFKKPIVWRLSDIWPFSGGCHYPGTCVGFKQKCGQCPALQSANNKDESYKLLERKLNAFESLDITIAAPSQWIAQLAGESTLFKQRRIEVIKTGVDEKHFKPLSKHEMRRALGVSEKAKLILFGADSASDPRKGIHYLIDALKEIKSSGIENIELGIFGRNYDKTFDRLGFPIHYFGYITELYLPVLYNCADVFVAPSVEENLPNTALEAMACGIPVCGFAIGGMPDLILHEKNGMISREINSNALKDCILTALENQEILGSEARKTILSSFTQQHQTDAYIELYKDLLDQ